MHRNIRGRSNTDMAKPNLISESIWPIHRHMQCCACIVFFAQRYVFSTLPIVHCPVLVFVFVLLIYIIWFVLHFHLRADHAGEAGIVFSDVCPCVCVCLSVCRAKKWKTADDKLTLQACTCIIICGSKKLITLRWNLTLTYNLDRKVPVTWNILDSFWCNFNGDFLRTRCFKTLIYRQATVSVTSSQSPEFFSVQNRKQKWRKCTFLATFYLRNITL